MGLEKERRKFLVKGPLVFGNGDVGMERDSANSVALLTGDTLNLSGAGLRVPHSAAALTNSNVGTLAGGIRVGYNGNVAQLAFVVNGSVIIFQATAGTGAVTSAVGA